MNTALLNSIENAIMCGCEVTFKKADDAYFQIEVAKRKTNQHQMVVLPTNSHMTEEKLSKYVTLMAAEIISNQLLADNNS